MRRAVTPLGSTPQDYRNAAEHERLREAARAQGLSVYVNNAEQRAGNPFIELRTGDLVLSAFSRFSDAALWLKGTND